MQVQSYQRHSTNSCFQSGLSWYLHAAATSGVRGDVQIINMHTDGVGEQVLKIFMRLRELMADMRLARSQHFAFHKYKDPLGNRLFPGHSNGLASFQLARRLLQIQDPTAGPEADSSRSTFGCGATAERFQPWTLCQLSSKLASL